MECVRCEKELTNKIEYDYSGNSWCKECMLEELEREDWKVGKLEESKINNCEEWEL